MRFNRIIISIFHFLLALVLAGGHASNVALAQGSQSDNDSNNTTVSCPPSFVHSSPVYLPLINNLCFLQIFVGGLDSDVSDDDLRQAFSQFGEVISVKIPPGKGCGFVQFANRCLPLCTSSHFFGG